MDGMDGMDDHCRLEYGIAGPPIPIHRLEAQQATEYGIKGSARLK
jgi:hypothetical protein